MDSRDATASHLSASTPLRRRIAVAATLPLAASLGLMGPAHGGTAPEPSEAAARAAVASAGPWTKNLVRNGSAEKTRGVPDDFTKVKVLYWTVPKAQRFTANRYAKAVSDRYAYGNRLAVNSPGPGGRGKKYFAGSYRTGPATTGRATQVINLKKRAALIKKGAQFKLSAWLGGEAGNRDRMKVRLTWLTPKGKKVGKMAILAPVTRIQRDIVSPGEPGGEVTMLKLRTKLGAVPKAARKARIVLQAIKGDSGVSRAYADKISLRIRRR